MRLVVVGGVAAGMSAAMRARRLDPSAEIVVLERGAVVSLGACGLPYYIDGRVRDWRELVARSVDEFRTQHRIDVRTGAEVVAIAHGRRQVRLRSGESIGYDKLVVATGARAASVDPGWFRVNTLDDTLRLKEHLRANAASPGSAVVVGGGYMGLEAVEALRANGWSVRLVTRGAHLLGRHDQHLTDVVAKHLERCRVAVEFNRSYSGGDDQLVLAATGLKPSVELAAEAGVELGRTGAIRADERMETNLHGVYAAGDCAESTHLVTGRPTWIPLGTTANKMGRVAGANAAGRRERFPGVVGTAVVRVCGLGVGVTGLSESQARREGFQPVTARIEARERPRYFRGRPIAVHLTADKPTGRLLGATLIGDEGVAARVNVVATALAQRMSADDFQHLDLAYAPPFATVWDPLLIAAQQLVKLLH
jgi:NADPH-dependent 2,4-dienoyl-CoA reductase/sulfur reductase-like enzyme